MQQSMAFKSGALGGRNAALKASGVRPARAAASRLVVQARQKEAGASEMHMWPVLELCVVVSMRICQHGQLPVWAVWRCSM